MDVVVDADVRVLHLGLRDDLTFAQDVDEETNEYVVDVPPQQLNILWAFHPNK